MLREIQSGPHNHKVVLVRADSLRPLEPPEAYKAVLRRVRGLEGRSAIDSST